MSWSHSLLSCFDYWLERYQTLLVGAGAIYVAAQQVKLMKTQEAIVAKQQDISEAQAKASVYDALSTIATLHALSASRSALSVGTWSVNGVPEAQIRTVSGDVVAIAFPDRVEDILAAMSAAQSLNAIYQRYVAEPWPVQFPGDHAAKVEAAPRMDEAEKAVRAFNEAFAKVRDIVEHTG
jgi:hypothetical protein